VLAAALFAAVAAVLAAAPASAHEHRHVSGDKYEFTVGWGDEPTYTGFKNSVSLTVKDSAGRAVTDIGDGLQVEVATGTAKGTFPLSPAFSVGVYGTPGEYTAPLVPTRAGQYSFRIFGTIHGDAINETFTSSDTTFEGVEDAGEVAFPAKDPSTGELAQRLDREVPRLRSEARKAGDDASGARTVGYIGIVVGAIGIVVGGIGLARRS
jgi:hypothetical protein